MVIVVILALAGLFFLIRAVLSNGAAMRVKMLEEELSLGRIEITQLLEQNLTHTAWEKAAFYQKQIDKVCGQLSISSTLKAQQIPFAVEFENWYTPLFKTVRDNVVTETPRVETPHVATPLAAIPPVETKTSQTPPATIENDPQEDAEPFLEAIRICFKDTSETTRGYVGIYLSMLSLASGANKLGNKHNNFVISDLLWAIPVDMEGTLKLAASYLQSAERNTYIHSIGEALSSVLDEKRIEIIAYLARYTLNGVNMATLDVTQQLMTLGVLKSLPPMYSIIYKYSLNDLEGRYVKNCLYFDTANELSLAAEPSAVS